MSIIDWSTVDRDYEHLRTRQHALALPDTWIEAYPHGICDEGDIGGDVQTGAAWTKRFVRYVSRHGLWAVINDSFYVADNDSSDSYAQQYRCWIENQTEIIVCTDPDAPGDTEIFTDYTHDETDAPFGIDLDEDAQWLAQASHPGDYGDPLTDRRIPAWAWQRSA